jgi:hypothetical protein
MGVCLELGYLTIEVLFTSAHFVTILIEMNDPFSLSSSTEVEYNHKMPTCHVGIL